MNKLVFVCLIVVIGGLLSAQTEPQWLWAARAGNAEEDLGAGISCDGSGNIYVTGVFSGTVTFGATTLTSAGGTDVYVAKLDTDGNWLWARRAGGPDYEHGYSICTTSAGISYITGYYQGNADFGPNILGSEGAGDIYVAKLDADGNWFWSIRAGGTLHDQGNGIAVDVAGNCFVTGLFQNVGHFGPFQVSSAGNRDIYTACLDPGGNWLWAKRAGGSYLDFGNALAVDSGGSILFTGEFWNTADFGAINLTSSGYNDVVICKLGEGTPVDDAVQNPPSVLRIRNYPNPFNPATTLEFSVPASCRVCLKIYGLKGQLVRTILDEVRAAGTHKVVWDARDDSGREVSSGVYHVRFSAGGSGAVRQLLLVK